MTDYSKLSNFEINKLVAEVFYSGMTINHPREINITAVNPENAPVIVGYPDSLWKDYCNNPSDAWPIIVKEGISIAFDTNEDEWLAWGDFEFDQCGWDMINEPTLYHSHANPLRAAMIVFLQMQENK